MKDEMLVSFGGGLKSLGDGRYGGFLVIFTDETSPDLSGDFFTKSTEFFVEDGASLPILYDHGLDDDVKRQKIGMGKVSKKDEGLWLEFQLERRAKYVAAIEKMCRAGKCGLSSGAAGHLVSRKAVKNASWVAEWGLAEGSITPEPMEPRTGVVPLKSYGATSRPKIGVGSNFPVSSIAAKLTQRIADLVDDGKDRESLIKSISRDAMVEAKDIEAVLSGEIKPNAILLKSISRVLEIPFDILREIADRTAPRSIKDLYSDELNNRTPSVWEQWNALCCVAKKLAEAAKANAETGTEFDYKSKLTEALSAFNSTVEPTVIAQVDAYVKGDMGEEFYLKSILHPEDMPVVTTGIDLDSHSELAVAAFEGVVNRFRKNNEARKRESGSPTKAGRVLSEKNRKRLAELVASIKQTVADAEALLDETKPMASDDAMRAAQTRHLALRSARRTQLGA